METSGNNEETLIWYNINDSRNLDIITSENRHTREFVPKVAIQKNVEIVNEMIPESTIQDTLTLDFEKMNVFEIISHQVQIISYLSAKFRSTDATEISWEFYKPYLQWILKTSEFITVKFNIPVEEVKQTNTVTRSSYKFCDMKDSCRDTYGNPLGASRGEGRPQRCVADHYVHNKIVRDLRSLISVIDSESSEQAPMSHYLRLGLTTTDFVIRHMYQELGIFNTYLKDTEGFDIETFYVCKGCKNNTSRTNNFGNRNAQTNNNHGNRDNRNIRDNRSSHERPKNNDCNKRTQKGGRQTDGFSKINAFNAFSALNEDSDSDSDEDSKPKKNKSRESKKPVEAKTAPSATNATNTFEFLCEMPDSDNDDPDANKIVVVNAETQELMETTQINSISKKSKDSKKSKKSNKKSGKKR